MFDLPSIFARLARPAGALAAFGLVAAVSLAPARAQTVTARVGYIPILGAAPAFVADKEGFAKAGGLAFRFTTFESGPNMIQALASGTLDVYVAGVAPLGVARSRGVDVRVVTATAVEEMTVAAGGPLAAFCTDGVSPADAFKAFRAKTGRAAKIATQPPGSVPHTTLTHWLNEVTKTAKADVDVVPMGIDATQQALLAGAVDGATIREPTVAIVQGRDPRVKVVALGGAMFPNQPGTVVAVSGAFAQKNPQATQALVDSIVKAIDLIQKEPARVAPHIEAALGKGIVDTATIMKALASPATKFVADPRVITEATQKMQTYQVSIGTLDKDVPLDGLFDASYFLKATGK
jgi:NitT/TauT family transport system substrate-binding protein